MKGLSHQLFIPFSAFWLRSSVVSVLISLISDTWTNGSHDIKLIFLGGVIHHSSLLLGLLVCRLGIALLPLLGTPQPILVQDFNMLLLGYDFVAFLISKQALE